MVTADSKAAEDPADPEAAEDPVVAVDPGGVRVVAGSEVVGVAADPVDSGVVGVGGESSAGLGVAGGGRGIRRWVWERRGAALDGVASWGARPGRERASAARIAAAWAQRKASCQKVPRDSVRLPPFAGRTNAWDQPFTVTGRRAWPLSVADQRPSAGSASSRRRPDGPGPRRAPASSTRPSGTAVTAPDGVTTRNRAVGRVTRHTA